MKATTQPCSVAGLNVFTLSIQTPEALPIFSREAIAVDQG